MQHLILASQSAARQNMLRAAGLEFEMQPANLDETAILKVWQETQQDKQILPKDMALLLAEEKARFVSAQHPGALVIGADQILECEGEILSKAEDKNEAEEKLKFLRGKTHSLISAVVVAYENKILWGAQDMAHLSMHEFDEEFLARYCQSAGQALTHSVGAYELESLGIQLFDKVEGNYFTILGLPLLPLLKYLREEHGMSL